MFLKVFMLLHSDTKACKIAYFDPKKYFTEKKTLYQLHFNQNFMDVKQNLKKNKFTHENMKKQT